MKYKTIWVAGIVGGGATLMRRLFMAFDNTEVQDCESNLTMMKAFSDIHKDKVAVGSRLGDVVFANSLPIEEEDEQVAFIKEHNIGILLLMRAYDVNRVDRKQWSDAYSAAFRNWDVITYSLSYHRLLVEPDVVQPEVAEAFGLTSIHKFTDYPDFIDPASITEAPNPTGGTAAGRYSLRKIGAPYSQKFMYQRRTSHFELEEKCKEQAKEREEAKTSGTD